MKYAKSCAKLGKQKRGLERPHKELHKAIVN